MGTKEKIDRINRFLKQQKDQRFLNMLIAMIDAYADEDWWDNMSENEKAELEKRITEVKAGAVVSNSSVRKKVEEKLNIKM